MPFKKGDIPNPFQSTHPHGVRLHFVPLGKARLLVSIHAPTRGATYCTIPTDGGEKFQSTHPHGVRLFDLDDTLCHTEFQSTHPHGVRPNRSKKVTEERSFNPRTHTGCDRTTLLTKYSLLWFQSTHPHGVRQKARGAVRFPSIVSIHAPTRGATNLDGTCRDDRKVSIHAPTRGATPWENGTFKSRWVSIHAPTRGATTFRCLRFTFAFVSIHAPTRGATAWISIC